MLNPVFSPLFTENNDQVHTMQTLKYLWFFSFEWGSKQRLLWEAYNCNLSYQILVSNNHIFYLTQMHMSTSVPNSFSSDFSHLLLAHFDKKKGGREREVFLLWDPSPGSHVFLLLYSFLHIKSSTCKKNETTRSHKVNIYFSSKKHPDTLGLSSFSLLPTITWANQKKEKK